MIEDHKDETTIASRIKKLLEVNDMNPTSLAKATGVPQPTIFRLLNDSLSEPRISTLKPIADYFGMTVVEMLSGVIVSPAKYKDVHNQANRMGDALLEEALELKKFKGVPIVGAVQGGIDGYLDEMEYPVGYGDGEIEFPTTDKNAYALRVRGESMRPRIKSGEYIVVTPNTQAQPGDDVVVICADGRKMVKELLYFREQEITLGSINSNFQPLSLQKEEIKAIHFVAGIIPRGSAFVK